MSAAPVRVVTWNAGHRKDSWNVLRSLDADVVLARDEVASSWAGLTGDRKQICVRFVRDQLCLSELDRCQAARETNR